jgi:FtsZ-interacting cell division protein ZipA
MLRLVEIWVRRLDLDDWLLIAGAAVFITIAVRVFLANRRARAKMSAPQRAAQDKETDYESQLW